MIEILMKKISSYLVGAIASVLAVSPAIAQSGYPNKEIRLIVPFATGGSATTSARIFADMLAKELGQQVYIDNRGGANGAIGATYVANAKPDGYSLLYSSAGIMTVNPTLMGPSLSYKVDQFAPVGLAATFASVLFMNPAVPAQNIQELVAYAKKNPGMVTFGSAGPGSSGHLWGERLKERAGIDIQHIPYKGTAPALIDVIGGRVTFVVDAAISGQEQMKAGNLRAIAVTSPARVASLPQVPTFAEGGLDGFEPLSWYGVFAPQGTPPEVIERLSQAMNAVNQSPAYKEALQKLGMDAAFSTPQALQERVDTDAKLWSEVIKTADIQP